MHSDSPFISLLGDNSEKNSPLEPASRAAAFKLKYEPLVTELCEMFHNDQYLLSRDKGKTWIRDVTHYQRDILASDVLKDGFNAFHAPLDRDNVAGLQDFVSALNAISSGLKKDIENNRLFYSCRPNPLVETSQKLERLISGYEKAYPLKKRKALLSKPQVTHTAQLAASRYEDNDHDFGDTL